MKGKENRATTLALLLLAGVAVTVNIASTAPTGVPEGRLEGTVVEFSPSAGTGLLYDQTDSGSGNAAPAQDFEAAWNSYDCEGADDFHVDDPSGWSVDQVNIQGTYDQGGPAQGVALTFYADAAGFPSSTPVAGCVYPQVVPADTNGSFQIPLVPACNLGQGNYWVAIQTRMDLDPFGQHFWANRSAQSYNESVWRNPGDGFGTGCTGWSRQRSCGVGGGVSPDFLFQILGDLITLIFSDGFETGTTTHWSRTVI